MKTEPFAEHQSRALAALEDNPERYYIAGEQGTGKTWILLAEAERRFIAGEIDGLLVVAPNGAHLNWVHREAPKHLSCPWSGWAYRAAQTKTQARALERLMRPQDPEERVLRLFAINIDAINTQNGRTQAARFLRAHPSICVVDEASDIKNLSAARTQRMIHLGQLAVARRCADGTPETENPEELFAQFEFLAPNEGLLGTTSYRAFVAEYAVLLSPVSGPVATAAERSRFARQYRSLRQQRAAETDPVELARIDSRLTRITPQIKARDARGHPRYRNLEKLNAILQPLMFRVLKEDCMKLPDKRRGDRVFELTEEQRALYDRVEEEMFIEHADGGIDRFTALTVMGKLRQITSGFLMRDGAPIEFLPPERNPRLMALAEELRACAAAGHQAILWAVYREELRAAAQMARDLGMPAAEYHGGVSKPAREVAVDGFQAGDFQLFIAQPRSAGRALTLTAARRAIYVSNDFSLRLRLQTEDRNHRHGTTESPLYTDLMALGTKDEVVVEAHRAKRSVMDLVIDGKPS